MSRNSTLVEAASIALGSLRASKLRSILTLLGVILATTTLIAVMSVIEGMNVYIAEHINEGLGAGSFVIARMVMIGQWDPKKYLEMQRRNPQLSREEFDFLKNHVQLSREIGMEADRNATVAGNGKTMERVELDGASPNIEIIGNYQAATGHFPLEFENQRRMPVAMLGNDVKERLFPGLDAIGKTVEMDGIRFEVIGVAKPKGSVFGNSMDNFVIIPIETYIKYYGARQGLAYHALAMDGRLIEAEDEVRQLLRAWRHLRPKEDDNFGVFTADAVVSMWKQMTAAIAGTAVAIVSVFMVVGGVVIMNIMLAVVTERTYEIGIRKAVGARRRDILRQFLVESSLMAAIGGLAGVILAWGVAIAVRNATPVPMAVPVSAIVVGVSLSAAVGLFFG
ncbi:MAG TPA: ABC transporter permease, partial [Bryobacteraceae bacterium]|nr:ABC transporter permease [Bryobacteraceae bacterium]